MCLNFKQHEAWHLKPQKPRPNFNFISREEAILSREACNREAKGLVTRGNFIRQLRGKQLQCMLQDHSGSTRKIIHTMSYDPLGKICGHLNVNAFSSWRLSGTGCLQITWWDLGLVNWFDRTDTVLKTETQCPWKYGNDGLLSSAMYCVMRLWPR